MAAASGFGSVVDRGLANNCVPIAMEKISGSDRNPDFRIAFPRP
jgi:hypothetical protein